MKYLPDGTPVGLGAEPDDTPRAAKQPETKEELPKGPWSDEPDYAEWMHEGIKCILLRGPFWSWNGYIGIPADNVFFHCPEDELWDYGLQLHGGPTYGPSRKVPGTRGITQFWWFGFDTAHHLDYAPGLKWLSSKYAQLGPPTNLGDSADIYRDFDYCVNELQTAAIELAKGAMK